MLRRNHLAGLAVVLSLFLGVIGASLYYAHLPELVSQHETLLYGQDRFVPGSRAALRVVVRDSRDASPLAGASVAARLEPAGAALFDGVTDAQGNVDVAFRVPAGLSGTQTLVVSTRSRLGSDRFERPVTLARDYRVLLSTDKPLYQPGQVIHVRALALSAFDQAPAAGQALELVVSDGKENKIFRRALTTSDFGVASADFTLADQVNAGTYKIGAVMGNTTSEKSVTVGPYALPKFRVTLAAERPYYLPGEHVRLTLEAGYFFGQPVAGSGVKITGYTFDVQRQDVLSLQGSTDAQGKLALDFDLPRYMTGSELEQGRGRFYLQAVVTDKTAHDESAELALPVAPSPLVIDAIPESGTLAPGVDNLLYVWTSYPDGRPADTTLLLSANSGAPIEAHTGAYGMAVLRLDAAGSWTSLNLSARDASGAQAERAFSFARRRDGESVLLRPARPLYRVGETMTMTLLASQPEGTLYVDVTRAGQTLDARALALHGGRAELSVDLTPDLAGLLELHAYKILSDGRTVRDTRLVNVADAGTLDVSVRAERDVYRPGETAGLDFQVSAGGQGVPAVLGVAVVDEAVFALSEQNPGFARLYFALEQELLEPKYYDLHGVTLADALYPAPANSAAARLTRDLMASMALARLIPADVSFSLKVNSHAEALERSSAQQKAYFAGLAQPLAAAATGLPLAIIVLAVLATGRPGSERTETQARLMLLAGGALPVILLSSWSALPGGIRSAPALYTGLLALLALGLGVRGNAPLAWMIGLTLAYVVVIGGLIGVLDWLHVTAVLGGWYFLAFFLVPLAYLALGLERAKFDLGAPGCRLVEVVLLLFLLAVVIIAILTILGPAVGNVFSSIVTNIGSRPPVSPATAPASAPGAGEPPRVRQYFPETLLWLPEASTDASGRLHLDVPLADNITTWRVSALASARDGRLGTATGSLRVFQDFFVDPDVPAALTVGDEVALPVGVFNYLPEPQDVRLEVAAADWFELLDPALKEVSIAANDVSVVYFRIKARQFGTYALRVTAIGSKLSDAVQRNVTVYPNGKHFESTRSGRLDVGQVYTQPVALPAAAIPGTQGVTVKIYPGVFSQLVEGLDGMLRMPYGCFEQTSSITYPNVLVLEYLRATKQASPETQMKAEEYINLGYQRLTTFEVKLSGGFSLFGRVPADRMLTAYGLQEFADMSRVHDVDPALVRRAAEWLLSQQESDGSWKNDSGVVHESSWHNLRNNRLPVTAYIAWSLADAGFARDARAQKGLAYVRDHAGEGDDAYVAALVANALVAGDLAAGSGVSPSTRGVLGRLAAMARRDGKLAWWDSGVATFVGSQGRGGSLETTALAAIAFLRAGEQPELANRALLALVQSKDSYGTWHSTQATVLALKALILGTQGAAERTDATLTVTLNGETRSVRVTPENYDVVQAVHFSNLRAGEGNVVLISASGEGALSYQVTGDYYLPWDAVPAQSAGTQAPLKIDVAYDRTELSADDTVTVTVTVRMLAHGGVESALIDLGVPPGFSVQDEDLAERVAHDAGLPGTIVQRYELTGRQVLLYIGNLTSGNPVTFRYRLKARFPLVAQAPSSSAYDYYNPDVSGEAGPQTLVVTSP